MPEYNGNCKAVFPPRKHGDAYVQYLKDKDMFGVLYRDMMAVRLLENKDPMPSESMLSNEKI